MAIITTNGTLGATAVITNTTLNDIANAATFVSGAVDGDSLELIADGTVDDGKLGIKDAGVTTAKVADSTDKTDGVTLPKIQHIDTAKVLGRTSADEGNVEEVAVVIGGTGDAGVLFDNDDMLDNSDTAGGSATRGATQQSIKAYVDSAPGLTPASYLGGNEFKLPNGLIVKFGTAVSSSDNPQTFTFANNGSSSFPNDGIHIAASGIPSVSHTVDKDGFRIDRYAFNDGSITFQWLAIGY